MSIENAKKYLKEWREGSECDGEWDDNTPIGIRGIYYLLNQILNELEKE